MSACPDCDSCAGLRKAADAQGPPKGRIFAIIGPPNSGKSTLFNRLTGLRQKVGNYPGITVEQRIGRARLPDSSEVVLIDLPGVYSLQPCSEDERVARDVLTGRMNGFPRPEGVLLILDSTNLGRHLMTAAPILALGLPTLVVLNMADDLHARGGAVDVNALSEKLGAPAVLASAAHGDGIGRVHEFLSGGFQSKPARIDSALLDDVPRCREWAAYVGHDAYQPPEPPLWTRRLDAVFLHPIAGPLFFLGVVVAVFQAMFSAARPMMNAIEYIITATSAWISAVLPDSLIRSLLIEGVWSGVGSVIIFLPQILLLFLLIGLLEDSGYLARAALIADRTMAKVGLQGKSFIPLISAHACAVPAILATRTIENKRDRIATILVAPLMTCSARLPVYTLIIAAFLPARPLLGPFLGTRAAVLLGLYILGFLAAIATARVLKSSILKSERAPFVLEMPPYRWPTLSSLGLRLMDRSKIFIRRAGTVILGVAIVLWCLAHLPLSEGQPPPIEQSFAGLLGHAVEPLIEPLGFNWKIGVGLITSLAAREVIVGTLGTIYGIESEAGTGDLQEALRRDLSPAGAVALLVFYAFALQCMSTIAVVRRETGGWRWPALQFAYMSVLAYAGAFTAYRLLA